MSLNKKKFENFIVGFSRFRRYFFETGIFIFGGVGFILSIFAIAWICDLQEQELPFIILALMWLFGKWLGFCIIFIILQIGFKVILRNKKNWGKEERLKRGVQASLTQDVEP